MIMPSKNMGMEFVLICKMKTTIYFLMNRIVKNNGFGMAVTPNYYIEYSL